MIFRHTQIKAIFEDYEGAVKEVLRNLSDKQLMQIAKLVGVKPVNSGSKFFHNDTVEDVEQVLFNLPDSNWVKVTREIFKKYYGKNK